jgi:hypothetical protein
VGQKGIDYLLNNAKNIGFSPCGEKNVSSKTCYSAENA